MDSNRLAIAARLKEARSRIFNTAAEAARALDMKPVTVRAHEIGQNGINNDDAVLYARRYGVDLKWLLTGKGEKEPGKDSPELEDYVPFYGTLQDGAWIPGDTPLEPMFDENNDPVLHAYTDPRFPPSTVYSFRVRSDKPAGHYPDGSIVFVIPSAYLAYRDGDHVFVLRERGDFEERSIKLLSFKDRLLLPLTSDEPALPAEDENIDIMGIVVGASIRRDVNQLPLEELKALERERPSLPDLRTMRK